MNADDSINLDCLSDSDLAQFIAENKKTTVSSRSVLGTLIAYVETLKEAREERLAGNIAYASELEAHCQDLYSRLPEEYQW
jgi:hypothetical protein